MISKLVVIINSLKVPKIKKILLYDMKFLLPNYRCLQNPWLGGYRPQIPVLSVLWHQLNLLNPPPPKKKTNFLGTPLVPSPCMQYHLCRGSGESGFLVGDGVIPYHLEAARSQSCDKGRLTSSWLLVPMEHVGRFTLDGVTWSWIFIENLSREFKFLYSRTRIAGSLRADRHVYICDRMWLGSAENERNVPDEIYRGSRKKKFYGQ